MLLVYTMGLLILDNSVALEWFLAVVGRMDRLNLDSS